MSRTDLAVSFAATLADSIAAMMMRGETVSSDTLALYRAAVTRAHNAVVLSNGDSEAPLLRRPILDRHAF